VKHEVLALEGCGQKATELPVAADCLLGKPLGQHSKSHRLDTCLDLPGLPRLNEFGSMFQPKIQGWQTGWRVPQGIHLGDTGREIKPIGRGDHSSSAIKSSSLVLGLLGLAGIFAFDGLHHRRRAGFGLLLQNRQVTQDGVVELERML